MPLIKKIRYLIIFFMIVIILSGITAFAAETELGWLMKHATFLPDFLYAWLKDCYVALKETNTKFPMLAYGYDWLAFAHLVIAMMFIGPYQNPVRNRWVIDWAILSCLAVFPLAFIAGPIRHIPMFHILIDCAFGAFGLIPLLVCRKWIKQLAKKKYFTTRLNLWRY